MTFILPDDQIVEKYAVSVHRLTAGVASASFPRAEQLDGIHVCRCSRLVMKDARVDPELSPAGHRVIIKVTTTPFDGRQSEPEYPVVPPPLETVVGVNGF